ncbi:hypothetical protein BDZ89DRAFT_1135390 [Hymenopellis radicata]|nr:hypothetical protein BDZ89DRAFT_1135390 [Hymenopellis radicata]
MAYRRVQPKTTVASSTFLSVHNAIALWIAAFSPQLPTAVDGMVDFFAALLSLRAGRERIGLREVATVLLDDGAGLQEAG